MSIYSILGPAGNKEFEDSMFVCPGGDNPEETDAPAGIWVDGAYEFLVGPSRGWVKMDSIRDGTSWPLCMDPRPGIHTAGSRNVGFLDGHVDMVREENTTRLIISAHSDQNLKFDRSIICAYFPEDCIP
jgi:prepilin-type processing-associated H-X9-DG protein